MSVIFLLIPLSIVIAVCFLGAFIWAVRSGQYEDTCTPSMRLLLEEKRAAARQESAMKPMDAPSPNAVGDLESKE
jgi:cbb3-type cytochrome oxidase maturation protein